MRRGLLLVSNLFLCIFRGSEAFKHSKYLIPRNAPPLHSVFTYRSAFSLFDDNTSPVRIVSYSILDIREDGEKRLPHERFFDGIHAMIREGYVLNSKRCHLCSLQKISRTFSLRAIGQPSSPFSCHIQNETHAMSL